MSEFVLGASSNLFCGEIVGILDVTSTPTVTATTHKNPQKVHFSTPEKISEFFSRLVKVYFRSKWARKLIIIIEIKF